MAPEAAAGWVGGRAGRAGLNRMGCSAVLILGAGIIVAQVSVFAISVYLHRALAHRSLTLHPVAEYLFRVIIWLTVGLSRQQWVAVHRKHHAFADVPGDPHSPLLYGFWKVQLGNVFYYLREAHKPEVLETWASDLEPDLWDRMIFNRGLTGIGMGIGSLMLAIGWWQGLMVASIHAFLNTFVLAPLINGLGHWQGQQNFKNTAYNNRRLAWVTGGESLHNNHHAYPGSPKFSMVPGELDLSWLVIRGLEKAGLASSLHRD